MFSKKEKITSEKLSSVVDSITSQFTAMVTSLKAQAESATIAKNECEVQIANIQKEADALEQVRIRSTKLANKISDVFLNED